MVCGNIPLKPKECYNCNKIICFLCELKITFKNGVKARDFSCYNCKTQEFFKVKLTSEKSGQGSTGGRPNSVRSSSNTPTPHSEESYNVIQHVYQPIKNKLLNQMIGQIKVNHKCKENHIPQCVFIVDLEKHIDAKCKGF